MQSALPAKRLMGGKSHPLGLIGDQAKQVRFSDG
jgi:hypothetical protein